MLCESNQTEVKMIILYLNALQHQLYTYTYPQSDHYSFELIYSTRIMNKKEMLRYDEAFVKQLFSNIFLLPFIIT